MEKETVDIKITGYASFECDKEESDCVFFKLRDDIQNAINKVLENYEKYDATCYLDFEIE